MQFSGRYSLLPDEPVEEPVDHEPVRRLLRPATTYEDEARIVESAHTSVPGIGLSTTTQHARKGEQAGVALLRPGDGKSHGGFRAEWHGVDGVEMGVERWQGISYLFPDDWHQGDNPDTWDSRIIFQWHGVGDVGVEDNQIIGQPSPIYGIQIKDGSIDFYKKRHYIRDGRLRGQNDPMWSIPLVTNTWMDFVFNTVWSTNDDGRMHVYLNKERVVDFNGSTLIESTRPYSKWGIYGQPTRVLFDEMRIAEGANRLLDVSP